MINLYCITLNNNKKFVKVIIVFINKKRAEDFIRINSNTDLTNGDEFTLELVTKEMDFNNE